MNTWMTIEEFRKEATEKNWYGWCWIYHNQGYIEMAFYLDDFYLNEDTEDDEKWNLLYISHVMPLDRPKSPEII